MKFKQKWFAIPSSDNHTYAAWSVSQNSDHGDSESFLTNGGCGCCTSYDEAIEIKEAAELMAAAPEMLIALREIEKLNIVSDEILDLIESLKHIEFEE